MGSERITKRLRQIPNAWHFLFHRWVLCLRWHGQFQWWRCSLLNAALAVTSKISGDGIRFSCLQTCG
ncbi:TPA: hypothetical protein I7747_22045 [Vibrio vulnificus]|nr:hypothetical protein [Vibrio vulnificus]